MALHRNTQKDFIFAQELRKATEASDPIAKNTMLVRAALHIEAMADEIDRLEADTFEADALLSIVEDEAAAGETDAG